MARTIKLPARANSLAYEPNEVADIIIALLSTPHGEGVIVDYATDTEPKARARGRTMAKLVKEGVTVTVADLDDIEETASDEDVRAAIIEQYAENDEGDTPVMLPGLAVRTHVVKSEETFIPVISRKVNSD